MLTHIYCIMNKSKILKAMFCVTFFSVSTRALGFLLKIFLSRELGSVLLGSYQVAMSIFGVLMTFVSSGIPIVLSRNVSYYSHKNDKQSIGSIVSSGLIVTGIICIVVTIVFVLFPNLLNLLFTSNASTQMIYILLPALVFSSIYEVLRGALWGQKKFFAISITEFIEQIVRILILFILFNTSLINISPTNKTALSLSLACVISAIIVAIIYFKSGGNFANPKPQLKYLIKDSTPITAVRTVSSIVSSIIAIIIPIRLQLFGYNATEALSEFGIIMGMTFPLIMIPSTLISSLAVTMVPSLSEQSKDIDNETIKDTTQLKSKIMFSTKMTLIFSSILIPTYLALGTPICKFIFNNSKAGIYLSYATIAMLPMGISQITSSILNAIGLEIKSLKNHIISSALLILSIIFLPKYYGTYSLIIGYFLMATSSSILNTAMLKKRKLIDLSFLKTVFYILLIIVLSSLIGYFTYSLLSLNLLFSLIIAGVITLASTVILFICFNIANFKVILLKKGR